MLSLRFKKHPETRFWRRTGDLMCCIFHFFMLVFTKTMYKYKPLTTLFHEHKEGYYLILRRVMRSGASCFAIIFYMLVATMILAAFAYARPDPGNHDTPICKRQRFEPRHLLIWFKRFRIKPFLINFGLVGMMWCACLADCESPNPPVPRPLCHNRWSNSN